ncbi:MAG: carbamoyltransferase HypF [Negativicutes bacterium]|nr:carbamoyltransferase HypF [Negativicutes bacterium]
MRVKIEVTGLVQGVGFRPFVYRLAKRLNLAGFVLNLDGHVQIEAEGAAAAVQAFVSALAAERPPQAIISEIRVKTVPDCGDSDFRIVESEAGKTVAPFVAPDLALCADCSREIHTSGNRRAGYAFTNCTNCGPRYTIIRRVPYDRPNTTMADFVMCPACQREFDDPGNRRFHAQPNACPQCGPSYRIVDARGNELAPPGQDPLTAARSFIASGAIVAIKGIGGYHLACDARNEAAVARLRRRKLREEKPLAVMCGSLAAVAQICLVSPAEAELLSGAARPIVLLDKSSAYNLAPNVAPGNPRLGVMLPYAPVHELLLAAADIWVMTSGNTSDEPIAYQDEDALIRLKDIADVFLVHNRPIHRRADDSVARIVRGLPYLLRRSRGYVPVPVALERPVPPLLACGGELKSTFCLAAGRQAFLSAHIGDLENKETFDYYTGSIDHYRQLLNITPELVACDLHPEYFSTRYAQSLPLPKLAVQHHHAHIASVMAEHRLAGPVIGVAFDGTGYGTDGALWGGEFLVADYRQFTRAAHCRYLPLPGGAKAIREPWRLALWLLCELSGPDLINADPAFVNALPPDWPIILRAATKGINSPLTSSAGRLFDAAAALLGIRRVSRYEGQAAIELELAAGTASGALLPYTLTKGHPYQLDFLPAFAALLARGRQGFDRGFWAASFHTTMAAAIVETVRAISADTGIRTAALSGGVFQNLRLLEETIALLERHGFTVYLHRQVPPNDGGLALGQAAIAAAQ